MLDAILSWLTHRRALHRQLRGLRASTIAGAQDGPVKLVGRVRFLGEPLISPVTGTPCAVYEATVSERTSDLVMTPIIAEIRETDFLLEDETGVAWIRTASCTVELVHDGHRSSGFVADAPADIEALLQRHQQSSTTAGWPRPKNRSLHYAEGILEANEEIVVCGTGTWEPDPDPRRARSYREAARRLVVAGTADAPLLVSDRPGLVRAARVPRTAAK